MALEVDSKDCIALSDAEISEMADLCAEHPVPLAGIEDSGEAPRICRQIRVICCDAPQHGTCHDGSFAITA